MNGCVLTELLITVMTVIQSHTMLCFSSATYTTTLSNCVKNASTGIPRYTRSHFTRFRYNAI